MSPGSYRDTDSQGFALDVLWQQSALAQEPDPALERIARITAKVLDASCVRIHIKHKKGLQLSARDGTASEECMEALETHALVQEAMENNAPIVIPDVCSAPDPFSELSPHPNNTIRFYGVQPLRLRSQVNTVGVIEVIDETPRAADEEQLRQLKAHFTDCAELVMTELEQRYEAIRHARTEAHLHKAAANMSEGLYRSTPEEGIVYANQAFIDLFGYDSLEDIVALGPDDLYADPTERDRLLRIEREHEGLNRFVVKLKRSDGSTFIARISSTVERNGEGEIAYFDGVVSDITEKRIVERELKRQEKLFRILVKNSQPIVFLLDENGTFLLSEGADLEALGLEPGGVVGQSMHDVYGDYPEIVESLTRALNGEDLRKTIHVDGNVFDAWYSPLRSEENNDIVGCVGMAANVTEQYRAEQARRHSAERWERLVSAHPDPIVVSVQGLIKYVNPAGVRVLGAESPEEIIGEALADFVVDETKREEVAERVRRVYEEGHSTVPHEHTIRWKDGNQRIVEVRSVPIMYNDQSAAQTIVRDITEQRHAEEALQEERDLLERIFYTSAAAITVLNKEGKIIEANSRAQQVLGISASDVKGRAYNSPEWRIESVEGGPFPEEDLPFERVRRTHEPVYDVQHVLQWPNGERRVVSINGAPILDAEEGFTGAVFTVSDITQQRAQNQALRETRQMLDAIINTAGVGICVTDEDGRFVRVNPAYTRLYGWTEEELIGKPVTNVLPDDIHEEAKRKYRQFVRGSTDEGPMQWTMQHKNGERREVILTIGHIAFDDTTYKVSTITDITDRVEAERALRASKKDAEAAVRLKSAMLANMSHEVRTPLTSIIGFADVLKEETTGTPQHFAGLITGSAQRLLTTLDSVLQLSKLEADSEGPNTELIELNELVQGIVTEKQQQARKKDVTLTTTCYATPVYVVGGRGSLQRIVYNLLNNAIKFTNPEGCVSVRLVQSDEAVMLEVADTGIGMEKAFQERMFKAFTQESEGLARTHEGSGLGLAIVQKLVDRLGGSIEVESTPGYGTRIGVFFPRTMSTNDRD